MTNVVKQRKKGSNDGKDAQQTTPAAAPRTQTEPQGAGDTLVSGRKSPCPELRTLLCLVCVAICAAMTWLVIQQSRNLAAIELKYQSLQTRPSALNELEDKVRLLFGKLEATEDTIGKVKKLQIAEHTEQLQRDISSMGRWSNNIWEKRDQVEGNLSTLQNAVDQIEHKTTSIIKELSIKIASVKTDVRRISGFESDITLLGNSVQELENKLEKVEKKTILNIGNVLGGSIDRITNLKNSVNNNYDKLDLMKRKMTELKGNFSETTKKLQHLENDRIKVIKAVYFVNDLKPKIFTIRKDFAHLEPALNDLSLRIGRLASDLLNREKDIVSLKEKILNLTALKSQIIDLSSKLNNISVDQAVWDL
ncbi:inhibitor of nuclear factor kappa-B kinase-interacting protein isoform X2 [Bombina bombina]|uniref:inhibitor of nuclear factor kappa-B kinase-interacting protein isoform X2 n=1 Tax=Bombina bombina TaxID=8345 RepID=UPI00235B0F9F|nr:inhibitor of nuclear factor kappa-B kinase-interacting protein isoform X2 [Bombina bombina]